MPYTSPSAPLAQPPTTASEANPSDSLSHPHTHSHTNECANTHANARSLSLSLLHAHPNRPPLSRSYSSQSYLRRHRRSPSYSKVTLPSVGGKLDDHSFLTSSTVGTQWSMSIDPHASLRQSPPPRNNAIIPSGAVISPPESAGNSSDEEVSPTDVRQVDLIDAALRSLQAERKNPDSPNQEDSDSNKRTPESNGNKDVAPIPALTLEARKISHSRSTSTESSLALISDSAETSSVDSEHEEDGERGAKPPMVRKKSGELVRPALRSKRRPSSMPGTPVFSKNVHFDAHLEHIRHFLQLDKPLAVSANTSPVETYSEEHEYPFGSKKAQSSIEWEIKVPNFPSNAAARRKHQPVRLERMFLSADQKNLVGVVSVANLAFQKKVVARFTVDYWKTISEVTAEYNHDIRRKQAHDGYDRFDFNVQLSDITDLDKKTLFVCIRYSVDGQEYWDNNDSMNYQVEFSKREKTRYREQEQQQIPSTRDHGRALPRSRNSPFIATRPRSMPPASFDDFRQSDSSFPASLDGSSGRHADSDFHLTAADSHDWLVEVPKPREKPASQAFGARYDFGLSLSAARSSGATEDRTTLSAKAKSLSSRAESPTTVHAHPLPPRGDNTFQPSAIVSSKPHLESPVYKELVDKYCFFSSTKKADSGLAGSPLSSSTNNPGTASPEGIPRADSGVAMSLPSDSPTGSPYNSSPIICNALYRETIPRSHSPFLPESQPAAILG
ncbi:hypothetical protein UA08_09342 [Talaromyces atroroseus]|uniref:CBM21 domain-containing protein n=1 Tax=Talaromyces atroroseus TaxID=1441469 RepID=A0A1Q5Q6S5_TALAT|nr:hypothetical protein UA08_09342 [Talaromyces atroroseus]OKL55391.1 hypothetical protein UA08_09342 [Talaromyces atroroseus]